MIIGLTGGLAAGKSTVRQILAARRGMEVFDADACARRLLQSNSEVIDSIRSIFGGGFIGPDGTPERGKLRELVFHNIQARRQLESLLHPKVRAEWQAARDRAVTDRIDFLADIPLLYETGADRFFDSVLVVACSLATQLGRLQERGISVETAKAMLASQLPLGQKIDRAHYVIWNDGSLAALGRQTGFFVTQIFPA